jgi:hypothetical protein
MNATITRRLFATDNADATAPATYDVSRTWCGAGSWLASLVLHVVVLAALAAVSWVSSTESCIPSAAEWKVEVLDVPMPPLPPEIQPPSQTPAPDPWTPPDGPTISAPEPMGQSDPIRDGDDGTLVPERPPLAGGLELPPVTPMPMGEVRGADIAVPPAGVFGSPGMVESVKERRHVYVIDRSGSMADDGKLDAAREELKRLLTLLDPEHEFLVVFYDDGFVPSAGKLELAVDKNKQACIRWAAQVIADGQTDPRAAMEFALAQKPHVITLLSDGIFPEEAVGFIHSRNPGGKVKIHTRAFRDQSGEDFLKQIAADNRGEYIPIR